MNENDLDNSKPNEMCQIPQWQIDEVRKAKAYYEQHPDELLSWEDVVKQLKCS